MLFLSRDLAEIGFLNRVNPRDQEINGRLLNLENRTRHFTPFGQIQELRRITSSLEKEVKENEKERKINQGEIYILKREERITQGELQKLKQEIYFLRQSLEKEEEKPGLFSWKNLSEEVPRYLVAMTVMVLIRKFF